MFRPIALRVVLPAMLALSVSSSDAATTPIVLDGVVGPGATITLMKGSTNLKGKTLMHGAYTIRVNDKATSHNFHLTGPGVNRSTTVAFKGMTTWNVTLQAGNYVYICDPHKSFTKGSFKVN